MNDVGALQQSRPLSAAVSPDPLIVEVTRGAMTESLHRVAVAVVDRSGSVLAGAGDLERPVYPRSAIKPLQALALVETGAADAFGLGPREIALACASHSGERRHVDAVRAWLDRIGCAEADLECGAHAPSNETAATALVRGGGAPSPVHNNCSGKHAGFLTVAKHLGYETSGYLRYEHPVQQRILGILEQMTGCDLGAAPRGIDGCGIPVIGMPLGNIAFAMAQFADPTDQPDARQDAARHIRDAMIAEPFYVAGSDRFDSWGIEAAAGRAVMKVGAEGAHCVALIEDGIGIAVKAEDGAKRAAEAVVANLLWRFGVIEEGSNGGREKFLEPVLTNHAGTEIGRIRVADIPFAIDTAGG